MLAPATWQDCGSAGSCRQYAPAWPPPRRARLDAGRACANATARQRHRSRYALPASPPPSPSTAQVCRDCGHVFAPPERRELRQVEGELQELAIAARARKQEQGQAQSLQDLIALGQQRGYKNPVAWAKHLLAARQTKSQWSKGK
jgi:hypothetical protein